MVISIEIGWNRFCFSKIESFAGAKSSNCVLDVPVGLEFPRPRVQTAMTQWFLIRSNQKRGRTSKQNKGHLGFRYNYIHLLLYMYMYMYV